MFHYFFPGQSLQSRKVSPALFAAKHLQKSIGDLQDSGSYTAFESTHEGQRGVMLTPYVDGKAAPIVKKTTDQRWYFQQVSADDRTGFYVGWSPLHPPAPETLKRQLVYPGYGLNDAQKRNWTIPIARSPIGNITLPQEYRFDLVTGGVTAQASSDYKELWDISGTIFDVLQQRRQLTEFQKATFALAALSVNYRIGPAEHNAMVAGGIAILDSIRAEIICHQIIDLEFLNAVEDEKKTSDQTEALSPSDCGLQDETPDTVQAESN